MIEKRSFLRGLFGLLIAQLTAKTIVIPDARKPQWFSVESGS